jgi:hypothetical protein
LDPFYASFDHLVGAGEQGMSRRWVWVNPDESGLGNSSVTLADVRSSG